MSGPLFGRKRRDFLSDESIIKGSQPMGTADQVCAPQRIKTVKQGLIPTRIQPTERWIKISLIPISRRSSQSISVPHNGAVQNPFIALSVCNSRQKLLGVLVLRNNNVLWLPEGACVPVRLPGTSAECLGLHLPCVWSCLPCKGACTSSTPHALCTDSSQSWWERMAGFFSNYHGNLAV